MHIGQFFLQDSGGAPGGGVPPVQGLDFIPIAQTGDTFVDNEPMPVTTWYDETFASYIILASEMNGAKTLDGISFWKEVRGGGSSNSVANSQTVKIAHTSSSEFPSGTLDPQGSTASTTNVGNLITTADEITVYSGTYTITDPVNEWTPKLNFTTDFEYNGTDNLVITWINDDGTYLFDRFDFGVQSGGNSTNRMIYRGSDSIPVEDMTMSRSSQRPATKLYY